MVKGSTFFLLFLALVNNSAAAISSFQQRELPVAFAVEGDEANWMSAMSKRVESQIPDKGARLDFLQVVLDESKRARLNPQLVLSVIDVASGFRKYAVSPEGARGYMQVAPSWPKTIGTPDANLFHLRSNIRYGCTVLRYFIDFEKGDLLKALGRYRNQSNRVAGAANEPAVSHSDFPEKVEHHLKTRWSYKGPLD